MQMRMRMRQEWRQSLPSALLRSGDDAGVVGDVDFAKERRLGPPLVLFIFFFFFFFFFSLLMLSLSRSPSLSLTLNF